MKKSIETINIGEDEEERFPNTNNFQKGLEEIRVFFENGEAGIEED